jgi:hypothetical protein
MSGEQMADSMSSDMDMGREQAGETKSLGTETSREYRTTGHSRSESPCVRASCSQTVVEKSAAHGADHSQLKSTYSGVFDSGHVSTVTSRVHWLEHETPPKTGLTRALSVYLLRI